MKPRRSEDLGFCLGFSLEGRLRFPPFYPKVIWRFVRRPLEGPRKAVVYLNVSVAKRYSRGAAPWPKVSPVTPTPQGGRT